MKAFGKMDKGALTATDMKQTKYKILYWIFFGTIFAYCMVAVLPVIWILLSGFKDVKEMYAVPATLLPKEIKLSKLGKVWSEMKFYKYYANTFIMAGGSIIADLLVSGLAGYVISRIKPIGTKVFFAIVFWTMLLPGTMRTVPLYMEFKDMPLVHVNLLNTYWPIWLMAAANAFNIILFKNFFDGISISLIESARLDGAGDIKIFIKIMVPLSVPVFTTVAIFAFNGQMGQFFWPNLIITDPGKEVLGLKIFKMASSSYTMDYQMLAFFFSIIPQLIIFSLFQDKIMGGVNVGGVKG